MRKGIIIAIVAVVALVVGGVMFAALGKKPSTLTLKPNVHIAGGKDGFAVHDVTEDSVTIDDDSSIAEGAIVAGGTGQASQNGFLRKVTSVKKHNGRMVLETEQAALTDAIKKADINLDINIDPDGNHTLDDHGPSKGNPLGAAPAHAAPAASDGEIFSYSGDELDATGSLTLSLNMRVAENGKIDFETKADLNLDSEFKLQNPGDWNKDLFTKQALPVTIIVDDFPVTLVNELSVSANGSVDTEADATVKSSLERTIGYRYLSGEGLSPIDEESEQTFEIAAADQDNLDASGHGAVNVNLTSSVFGIAGPEITTGIDTDFDASLERAKPGTGESELIELPGLDGTYAGSADVKATAPLEAKFNASEKAGNPFDGKQSRKMVDAELFKADEPLELYAYSREIYPEGSGGKKALAELEGKMFVFSSGAGAWNTSITMEKDGKFTGSYIDANVRGEHTAEFNGRFEVAKRVDEYTYKLKLKDLKTTTPTGEKTERDGRTIEYAEPYGFEKGTDFDLYLPGHPTEGLHEEYLYWSYACKSSESAIDHYGLFNVEPKYGMCTVDD
ncbi:hypothetical protein HMPREF3172_09420 [Brevibacterium sp. HMSC08F02]|uniref:hypothetical protein n=1 Tax=Brevibacterium sp. HMSC08F02 TaxID=1581140 RepID=UPI0008A40664|nr:hypothetical protein [Brevibacterium sp. HMSC08F02]OFT25007.1 hypothetical protein HMPREF3172_09420 [Brevibacterium sp. HMSC08F02]